jgi:phenylpropionate dioxygenase-like ring-hydroxylating dioxygenase large terminal subunit
MKPSKYSDFAHIGPGTLAGRFIRHFWQPVYVGADLKAGRPVRIQILGEYFTLFRGDSGTPYVLEDRCPHRQTSLVFGWVEGDCIRCFYHGWKFDGHDGQCTEQPAEKANFAAKVKARAYPTQEYLGLIFAYLGEGEAPALPRFPELDEVEGVLVANRHPVPCNYFQRIENDLDETHVHFVHRVSTDSYGLNELPDIDVEETDYGILRVGARQGAGANLTRTAHWMMPNVHFLDLPPSPGEHDGNARDHRARSAADDRGRARRQDPHPGYRSEIPRFVRRARQRRARGARPHRRPQPRLARPIGQGHHPVAQALGARAQEDRRRQAAQELAPAEREAASAGRPAEGLGRGLTGPSARGWQRLRAIKRAGK